MTEEQCAQRDRLAAEVAAEAPPLSAEQCERLEILLQPGLGTVPVIKAVTTTRTETPARAA